MTSIGQDGFRVNLDTLHHILPVPRFRTAPVLPCQFVVVVTVDDIQLFLGEMVSFDIFIELF